MELETNILLASALVGLNFARLSATSVTEWVMLAQLVNNVLNLQGNGQWPAAVTGVIDVVARMVAMVGEAVDNQGRIFGKGLARKAVYESCCKKIC